MYFTALQRDFTSRLLSPVSFLRCSLSSSARPPKKRDPKLRLTHSPPESIQSPSDFLKAIGRESEKKLSVESWTQFWKMDGRTMRKDGVSVKDRRYVLILSPAVSWYLLLYRIPNPDISCGVRKSIV